MIGYLSTLHSLFCLPNFGGLLVKNTYKGVWYDKKTMSSSDFEFINLLGGWVRYLLFYPFTRRKFKTYFSGKSGSQSKRIDLYNWIAGLTTLIVIIILIKVLI